MAKNFLVKRPSDKYADGSYFYINFAISNTFMFQMYFKIISNESDCFE